MNNDIKEILDEMKFMQEKKVKFYSLDIHQSKLLLDYITNLQEERDRQVSAFNDLYNFYHNFINKYNLQSFWDEYTNLTKGE